jgi:hypothetical protein
MLVFLVEVAVCHLAQELLQAEAVDRLLCAADVQLAERAAALVLLSVTVLLVKEAELSLRLVRAQQRQVVRFLCPADTVVVLRAEHSHWRRQTVSGA